MHGFTVINRTGIFWMANDRPWQCWQRGTYWQSWVLNESWISTVITSRHGDFRFTGPLCWESTGDRRISLTHGQFEGFIVASMSQLLNKHLSCRRFESPWRLLNVTLMGEYNVNSQHWVSNATQQQSLVESVEPWIIPNNVLSVAHSVANW